MMQTKEKMDKSNISTLVDLAQRIMRKNEKDPVSNIVEGRAMINLKQIAMDTKENLTTYPYNKVLKKGGQHS